MRIFELGTVPLYLYCKLYILAPYAFPPYAVGGKFWTRSVRQEDHFSEQRNSIYVEKVSI